MIGAMEDARHADERGSILNLLKQDYAQEMTPVGSLRRALDVLGYPMSQVNFDFHLTYLAESGYIKIWRQRDMPGYRPGGFVNPAEIRFCKLLRLGLQLIDHNIPEDPKVTF